MRFRCASVRARRVLGVLGMGAIGLAACQAEAPPPKSPPQPNKSLEYAPSSPGDAPPASAPQPGEARGEPRGDRQAALRAARSEILSAQRELEASQSDCAAACRALGSMERATGHLCDLASE